MTAAEGAAQILSDNNYGQLADLSLGFGNQCNHIAVIAKFLDIYVKQVCSMREDVSSQGKGCDVATAPKSPEVKEKKKRKKSNGPKSKGHPRTPLTSGHPSTPLTADTEKPHGSTLLHNASSLSPLPALLQDPTKAKPCRKQDGDRSSGSGGRRTKRRPKDLTASPKGPDTSSTIPGAPAQGDVAELSAQAKESLRWEGVLEDPLAEERRLEVYKANRRQRYLAHRQGALEISQASLTQDRGNMVLPCLDQ